MAQVNCAVHGGTFLLFLVFFLQLLKHLLFLDLCRKNKIDGYTQMNLYRNGQFVETFRDSREHDILTDYLNAHAEPRSPPPTTTPSAEPITAEVAQPENDPLVAEFVSHEDANPDGVVVALDEKNYQATIDKGHVFVKFFAPWYVRHFY